VNNYTVAGNVITSGVNDTNINANANFTISSGGNLSNPATTSNIIGGVTLCNSTLGVNCNAPAYTLDVLGSAAYTPASLSATARLTTPAVVWSNSNIPLGTFASNTSFQLAGLQLAYNGGVYGGNIAGGIQQNVGGVLSLGTSSGAAAVNNYENMRMTNCNTWFPAQGGVQITGNSGLQLQVPGSIFFPGTAANAGQGTGYSTSLSNVATAFGASNFTIELWAYPTYTSTAVNVPLLSTGLAASSEIRIAQSITASNTPGFVIGTTAVQGTAGAIVSNTWYHVALVRNANVFTMYINGVSNAGATITGFTFSNASRIWLGRYDISSYFYTGFIGNIRITNGLAVYTAPFTPPVGALPFIPGTSLLMNMFTSDTALTDTVNNTPFSLFNGAAWSMYSPGYAAGAGNAIATLGAVGTIQQVAYYPNANTGIPTRRLDIRPTADYTIIESTGEMQVNSTNGGLYLKSFNYGVNLVGSNSAFTFSNSATSTNVFNVASNGALSNSNVTSNTIGGVTLSNGILAVTSGATAMPATMTATQNIVSGFSTTVLGSVTGTATSNVVDDATIYSFTAGTGTFAVAAGAPVIVDYLIVGGGGSGGNGAGGGGGAGGVVYMKGVQLPAGSYAWTVGGGGASQATNNTSGTAGSNSTLSNSTFGNMVALGGGAGGGYTTSPAGGAGASGGGAAGGATVGGNAGGSSATGQGFVGGTATSNGSFGGGGGGAGGSGIAGAGSGGTGGLGLVIPITGSNVYYAGGGGASTNVGSGTSPAGGLGGGGAGTNGALNVAGTSGLANSGGGGGASGNGGASGAGGSGVIIIRVYTNTSSRMLIGDGGGYSMALSAQSNGITTDVMTVTDKGNVSIGLSNAMVNLAIDAKFDSLGNLYVADFSNCRIRKITPTGLVTTFVGNGSNAIVAGTGGGASIGQPTGLVITDTAGTGTMYVSSQSHRILAVTLPGAVMTVLAGSGVVGSNDAVGAAATFNTPRGLAYDTSTTYLYVADTNNLRIRRIVPSTGVVTTRDATAGFSVNPGASVPTFSAGLYATSVAFDSTYLYVPTFGTTVFRIPLTGAAAAATALTSTGYSFTNAYGIIINAAKTTLYITDQGGNQVRSLPVGGGVNALVAGSSTAGSLDATGSNATFSAPQHLTIDAAGSNLYVGEYSTNKVRKINLATSNVTTYVGTGTAGFADGSVPTATTVNNTLLVSSSIGINCNVPQTALDVNGNALIGGQLVVSAPAGQAVVIGSNTASGSAGALRITNAGTPGSNYIQSGSNVTGSTAAPLLFTSMNGGAEWARFDATGKFGIGNSSPTYPLDVQGALRCYNTTYDVMGLMSPTYGNYIHIGSWNQAGSVSKNLVLNQNGGNVGIANTSPAKTLDVNGVARVNSNWSASSATPVELFALCNTAANDAVIRLGFGSYNGTTASIDATVNALNNFQSALSFKTYTGAAFLEGLSISSSQIIKISSYTTNGAVSTISGTGTLSVSSDRRIKTNIQYMNDDATSKILALKPARFELMSDPSNTQLGFIAQDVETVIPEAVDGKKYEYEWKRDENGNPVVDSNGQLIITDTPRYRGFSDRPVLATLVKAFQELSARLSNVEARLAAATTP
jgi:hypothetical protein